MSLYDWLIIFHLLLFVYWLGGDMGVFYSSSMVINPKLSNSARVTAGSGVGSGVGVGSRAGTGSGAGSGGLEALATTALGRLPPSCRILFFARV